MDNRINKILQVVILTVVFASCISAQRLPFYLKADAPEYIQTETEFDVSLLFRIFDFSADEIVLHILTADAVDLNAVKLNGTAKQFKLNNGSRFKKSYDVKFNLRDEQINYESFLNLTLTLISNKFEDSQVEFKIDYIKDKNVIRKYSSADFNTSEHAIENVILAFYNPQKTSGKSIVLKENSELSFSFQYKKEISKFLVEFWGRFEKPSSGFLKFINGNAKDTLLSVDINKSKILSTSDFEKISFIKNCFISKNAWYHFSIFINTEKSEANIYVNNNLALTTGIENSFAGNNFELIFQKLSEGKIEIDQLKVWEFKNSPGLSLANKNYENYTADSSRIFLSLSFNDENFLRNFKSTNAVINSKNIVFKNSTAPIYSRAPELNVYLYNDFYQIEWNNNSRKDADYFELEKSFDGNNYKKIFESFALGDAGKTYYFSDPKDTHNGIIYYRVKQINKDRSVVYSSSIKIGQGEIKLFKLGQNYPNPFNPQTTISIEMLEAADVDIYVYDIVGEKVAVLNSGILSQGIYTFSFDGSNLPSGIYFCEAKSEKFTDVRKMILAK